MYDGRHDPHDEEGDSVYDTGELMMPQNIIDMVAFGRRLRALRILAGYDRATEFTAAMRSQYGVDLSDRTMYAIERGEQMPRLDFYFAAICELSAARDYFSPAIRFDVVEKLARRQGRE